MKYVAFLRGINAGGHPIVKMADWKQLFESLGLESVQTYIDQKNRREIRRKEPSSCTRIFFPRCYPL
jgi:Protein of unknown function (DUF1697)